MPMLNDSLKNSLNDSLRNSNHNSSNNSLNDSNNHAPSMPHQHANDSSAPRASDLAEFICVSAALRRLLLQADVTGNRMHIASIEGEAGTGKHLFAQTIHRRSEHATLPFRRRDAREWLATDTDPGELTGTLYLDRIDMLAPAGQSLLLNLVRTLPDKTNPAPPPAFQPSGLSRQPGLAHLSRFLLLVSSHAPLRHLAAQGKLLPDLAFRLSAVRFSLPPLREHREDIAPIAQALVDRICRRYQQPTAVLAQGTLPRLLQHTWPGNVRELAAALESAILESETGTIRPSDLALALELPEQHAAHEFEPRTFKPNQESPIASLNLTLDLAIQRHIQTVLKLNRGNKLRTARQLGISRSTLYRLLVGESGLAS
ncbi:sigma 54-interacting transcriptional regulator [Acidicapsa ligni]|uniref:sigma 54-interacting transcriptional regulator n=1 Tax=Acidicapsa ligni TaxID=542300 RepID=UPI0021E0B7E9|nr:sigma 54-interacting transcriptional regulator [Acidicapsa ligni]